MLKKISFIALLIAPLVLSLDVHAGAFDDTRGYFGAEVSLYNRTMYNGGQQGDLNLFKSNDSDTRLAIRKNKPGINVFIGMRFTENFGIEAGFGFIDKVKAQVQNGNMATNKISNIYLDGLGFLPVSQCVDLIGLVGIGQLKSKPDVSNAVFTNKDQLTKGKIGYRIGGGAQYNISYNWSTRALLRYQSGNKDFLKGLFSIALGITYTLD